MMENGLSVADAMALGNNEGGWNNGWFWIIVLFIFGGWGNGFGGNNKDYATSTEVQAGFNNQNMNSRFDTIAQNQTNAAYENANLINKAIYDNAQLINNATIANMQNTNSINENINGGVYGITQTLNNGFNGINTNINNLAHQLDQCCCNLKSQMLQDKYDDVRNQLNLAEIASSNAYQTNTLLSSMGRWYPYAPPLPPVYATGTTIG